jgi:ABC-type Fe3+-hydroxamate transport system substrate-binding protein
MRIASLATALLLPLLAIADTTSSTTTTTSTSTLTKTITVMSVVASVTSTYANGTNTAHATGGTPVATSASATKSIPANYMGAASNLNGAYGGSAGVLVMIAAALL